MAEKGDNVPGTVMRLAPDRTGGWSLSKVNMDSDDKLDPGIYIIRHGVTEWNGEYKGGTKGPERQSRALFFQKNQGLPLFLVRYSTSVPGAEYEVKEETGDKASV